MELQTDVRGLAMEQGLAIVQSKGAALIWMSAGNSYFKEDVVQRLLERCSSIFSAVYVMAPEAPAEHTYRGMGYDAREARRKAQLNANLLMNRARRAHEALHRENIFLMDWSDDIERHPEYLSSLREIEELYDSSEAFRSDALRTTMQVIAKRLKPGASAEEGAKVAVKYLLEEFAFICASTRIFGVERIAYVYHRDWEIFRKLVAGEYDGKLRSHLGFVIMSDS